jgi:hypothetical protein
VQVHKASAEELLDSQRVSLTVDQRGVVLAASASPKALFGFDAAADLVGHALASFVNVFEEFRGQKQPGQQQKQRGGGSAELPQRFSQLALQVGPGPDARPPSGGTAAADDAALLTVLAQAAQEGRDATYRVGVRSRPLADDLIGRSSEEQQRQQQAAGGGSALLAALSGHGSGRLRPALMRIDAVEMDWTQDTGSAHGVQFQARGDSVGGAVGCVPVLSRSSAEADQPPSLTLHVSAHPNPPPQVQLWCVERVRAALDVDTRLKLARPDAALAQMLGLPASATHKKLLSRYVRGQLTG